MLESHTLMLESRTLNPESHVFIQKSRALHP
jgi:hypothetical protein